MPGDPDVIFVYGSLMRGLRHHDLLGTARPLGPARTAERLVMLDLGAWPGLREPDPPGSGGPIVGELYAVDAPTLAHLDALEDVPHLYVRRRVTVEAASADVAARPGEAWIYVLAPACGLTGPRVAGGCWRSHLAIRNG